jgi:hypothetical protein
MQDCVARLCRNNAKAQKMLKVNQVGVTHRGKSILFCISILYGAGFGIGFAAAILIKWGHIGKWCKIEGNLVWPIWPGAWARPGHGGQQELDQANPCASSGGGSRSQSSS